MSRASQRVGQRCRRPRGRRAAHPSPRRPRCVLPKSEVITGTPCDSASTTGRPKPSWRDGKTQAPGVRERGRDPRVGHAGLDWTSGRPRCLQLGDQADSGRRAPRLRCPRMRSSKSSPSRQSISAASTRAVWFLRRPTVPMHTTSGAPSGGVLRDRRRPGRVRQRTGERRRARQTLGGRGTRTKPSNSAAAAAADAGEPIRELDQLEVAAELLRLGQRDGLGARHRDAVVADQPHRGVR